MSPVGIFSLAVLGGVFIFQVYQRITNKYGYTNRLKFLFLLAIVFIFGYYLFLVSTQYLAWRDGGELTKFFVPPYRSAFYVFGYHFTRFALHYVISFAVALSLLFSANHFNKKYGHRFFEPEEPYLGALSVFLLGNPAWNYAWIYYLVALLLVAVLVPSYQLLVTKENRRFSLRWLWLPVAISVIIVISFVT